jgi:capsular exopolysaccharide synthesis family protein
VDQTAPDTLDLRDYIRVLRRRWAMIAGLTILVVLASQAVAFVQTPVYQARVQLAIEPVRDGSDTSFQEMFFRADVVQTETIVLTSRPVSDRVIAALALDTTPDALVKMVSVAVVPNTSVVNITARDVDPTMAAQVADGYAAAYLDYIRDEAIKEISAARVALDARAREFANDIAAIDTELALVPFGSVLPNDVALRSQRDSLALQSAQIGQALTGLDPGGDAIRGGGKILTPADVPTSPVSPRPVRSGALAFVLGLMLGVGIAFLRDHFDDAVRSDDDVARASGGRPVLGRITHWGNTEADERLITIVDPHDSASEEFQALAANVRFSLLARQTASRTVTADFRKHSILVTSALPGEGKSTVAGNLAVAAASSGMRVILVGSDLRQPTIGSRFGIPRGLGLSDLLVDASQLSSPDRIASYLVDIGIPRLRVLPGGTVPPNPTELLASPQMTWLHTCLIGMADLIIYDTPPVLPVADTLQLASHVDTCIVVARTTKARRRELQAATERLDGIGADVAGFVINDVSHGKRSSYGYGYGADYGYSPTEYRPRDESETPASQSGPMSAATTASLQAAASAPLPMDTA